MQRTFDKVLAVLAKHLSPVNARALLIRVLAQEGIERDRLNAENLRRCSRALRRGLGLFVPESQRDAAMREITEFCGSDSLKPVGCSLQVSEEIDIGRVRAEARRICTDCGTTSFSMQRVATIVSELARNMVLYAGGGQLDIAPNLSERVIKIQAEDKGPGIPDLQHVMSGRYKSRTGMGRGLIGTKRLADTFHIDTGPRGTRVRAEVRL